MNLDRPQVLDALASEYVLGTLRGAARLRFERERSRRHVEQRVRAWEDRLTPLAYGLKPVAPPAHVWSAIERRIASQAPPQRRGFSLRLQALAATVAAVAVLAGGYLAWRTATAPSLELVATIAAPDARPIWTIETDERSTRLRAVIVGAAPEYVDRVFELWALPEGAAPVSLGLLPPSGRIDRDLNAAQAAALRAAPQVAVSLEPPGGSPTGAPTGPILFMAERRLPG